MMINDRQLFAAMILIPILVTACAGYALRNEKLDTIPVAFVDEDRTDYSTVLIERLLTKEGLTVTVTDRDSAQAMLKGNEVEQVYIIRKGFKDAVEKGDDRELIEMASSPSSYSSGFTRELVAGEVMRLVTSNMAANDVVRKYGELGIEMGSGFRDEVKAYADGLWEPEPLMTVTYKEMSAGKVEKVPQAVLPAASASSMGLLVAFIMFYMLFGSGWLIEERLNGTIKRLAAANGAVAMSFLGSMLALLAAGILQIMVFSAVLKIFFGVELFSGMLSYLVLLSYLLAVVAISMFLSSVFKTQAQMQAAAPVLALFTGFAGGCFWNHVEVPGEMRFLSLFTPQGWALRGLNSVHANPSDLSSVLLPVVVLFAALLILLPASYIIINMQLKCA